MSLEILTQPAQFNSTVSVLSSIKAATIELTHAKAETLYNPATATGAFLLLSVNGVNKAIQLWDYVPQVLAIRYVGTAGDGDWSNPLNWTDAEGNSPATILPLGDFDVQIFADIAENTGNPAQARTYSFYDNAHNFITLYAFSSFTFYNNSFNAGTLQGNATFLDNSSNIDFYGAIGTVNGNANFFDNSSNTGNVQGDADVWYPVPLPFGGTVTGTLTYHGYPVRFTNTAGDGDWSNLDNWTDDTGASVTFLPTSAVDVKIYDKVTKVSQGEAVAHNATFFNSAALEQVTLNVANNAIFRDSTYNFGAVKGNARFLDSSTNGSLTEDIFFTPLHMHFNGTNGSQIFIDSSTYDHNIIYGGEPFISTEHGVFGGPDDDPYNPPSLYLDGSSYIQSNQVTDEYQFGSKDFTIEFWVYPTSGPSSGYTPILCIGAGGNSGQEIRIAQNMESSGNVGFIIPNGSNNGDIGVYGQNPLELNLWSHLALVREGNAIKLYVNGFVACSTTNAGFNFTNSGPLQLGYGFYSQDGYFNGYIDELRIVNGKAVYTSEFNVPVQPLSNLDAIEPVVEGDAVFNGTSLNASSVSGNAIFNDYANNGSSVDQNITNLMNGVQAYWKFEEASGDRIDSSGNNNTITESGGTVSNGSGIIGNGANVQNGNNAWLTLPAGLCDVGSGQKSFSLWFKLNQTNVGYQFILNQGTGNDYSDINIFYIESNSTLTCLFNQYPAYWTNALLTNIIPTANEWHHAVLTFNGSTANLYYDGSLVATSSYGGYVQSSGSQYTLGHYDAYPNGINGQQGIFSGSVDEFGIWNRELSSQEVAALYNQRTAIPYPFTQTSKSGLVLGTGSFYNSTKNVNGIITEGEFNDSSINSSTVSLSAKFTGTSKNLGTVNIDAEFHNSSSNGSAVDTLVLMHFDGSQNSQNFVDSSNFNTTFSWDGYPYIDNGNSVFGGGSLYIDGYSTDIYPSSNGEHFALGSGDFTIEFWVYPQSTPYGNYTKVILDFRTSYSAGYPIIFMNGFNLMYNNGNGDVINGDYLNPYNWYHIAVVRNGNQTRMYINGNQTGSTYNDTNNYQSSTNRPLIGNSFDNYPFCGYIDELRIVKGKAIYTGSSFTVPTAPLSITQGILGNVGGKSKFYDTSKNSAGLLYYADFYDYSYNDAGYDNGGIYYSNFYGNSYNNTNGFLLSASFFDSSINYGVIFDVGNVQAQSRNNGYITTANVYYPAHYPLEGTFGTVTYYGYNFGCTDPNATNYDPNANTNDGSCIYTPTPLTQDIFAYWKLDESTTGTRADATGNNNNLSDPNNNVTSGNGIVNSGAQFNQNYLELN
jgi:hypothetical protein